MKLSEVLSSPYRPKRMDITGTTVLLDRAVDALQKKYGFAVGKSDPSDLESRLIGFEDRFARDDWSRFPWHKASDLFRSFFTSDEVDNPRWSGVADVLLDTLAETDHGTYCLAALDVYVETFDAHGENLTRLRSVLRTKPVGSFPVRSKLIEELSLFDPDKAPEKIGRALAQSDTPYDLLKSWGIRSPHATGLFQRVFDRMLAATGSDFVDLDRSAFERVMNWLHPNSTTKAEVTRAVGIDALVLPLADERGSAIRDDVEKFLIGTFGDPRVSPAEWVGVSEAALEIVYRWMTSKSLKIFFDIIDQFQDSHMWEPRRRFWTGIDEREWIDDAWVVLNDRGADIARDLARRHEDKAFLSHGAVDFQEREKCFFIMKVGDLTIVEGTHDFSVRIFDPEADNAPRLRGRRYERNEIYAKPHSDEGEAHRHDQYQNWMRKTEDYMRRNRR
ncbi:MAG: hypothetical protein JJ866_20210 [Roseibium sp.]|uniref:EH signature domain-containing protein n=1 Tax=Roseibium sp. TaxID=1936156 RepID=UPI001B276363|nr:EH signature domain-containing protein [Roseibium sp.]MBO6894278.1 hypothetical protein [Roseibium sp.]MBO6929527.1 hypothetical protein [Roseibium sp.]